MVMSCELELVTEKCMRNRIFHVYAYAHSTMLSIYYADIVHEETCNTNVYVCVW